MQKAKLTYDKCALSFISRICRYSRRMDRLALPVLLICALPLLSQTPNTARSCVGASAVGTFRLLVKPPSGSNPLGIRSVNNIAANSKLTYEPIQLPDSLKKNGKLALVIMPADLDQRAAQGATVLEPKPVGATAEWTAPFTIGTLLVVFAPQGLDEKRVTNLVSRDEDLIDDLARYAERTVQLENTLEEFNALDEEEEIEDPTKAPRGTPVEQALFTLTRALNPNSTFFNPLSGGRTVGPQTKSGLAAGAFFENAGALFPGGGALSMAKTWLLPDSEFRTVYTETAPPDGLTLCSQKNLSRTRNRVVYLWGYQLIGLPAPKFSRGLDTSVPSGAKSAVSIKTPNTQDWPLLDRFREWSLVNTATKQEIPVRVRAVAKGWADLDLRKSNVAPGNYTLRGRWDWETVNVDGTWRVNAPGDLKAAKLTAESASRLVEGSGMEPVELEGTDFQFVERVALKRAGTLGAINTELAFRLPQGFRNGPQNRLEVEINTDTFRAGPYLLAVQQMNGKSADIPLQIAPVPPRVSNLPIRLNLGETQQRITLRGSNLDRFAPTIDTSEGIKIQMLDGSDTERDAVVQMAANLKRGAKITRSGLSFQVVGAKPKLTSATATLPDQLPAELRTGELPSGTLVSFLIRAENVEAPAALVVDCADATRSLGALRIRLGERKAGGLKFDAAGQGSYFAAFDPGTVGQSGCDLQLAVESEASGKSAGLSAGRVTRLPKVTALTWTEEKATGGYVALLKGTDLELIEKAGWEGQAGVPITEAPKAATGDLQSLKVVLPWPPPSPLAPVMVWLRGDSQGRKVKY
jgi:hypothetical protein